MREVLAAGGQMELGRAPSRTRADEPPADATEVRPRRHESNAVVDGLIVDASLDPEPGVTRIDGISLIGQSSMRLLAFVAPGPGARPPFAQHDDLLLNQALDR